jgi:transcriptional regulator with GAF, ATPase, and Fis domain
MSNREQGETRFLTEIEMRRRERDNLVAVLETAGWKVMGQNGAAELLGVKPTTLFSRMKKLGLRKTSSDAFQPE